MFDPPAAFDDMLADADDTPATGAFQPLKVPGVGVISARKPMPNAAAALGSAVNAKISGTARQIHLTRFVRNHLAPGEHQRLVDGIDDETFPADTVTRVARAIATWGTARPFGAVVNLSLATAHHWRDLRSRLTSNGVPRPLEQLPSLHALLDVTEQAILEGKPKEADRKVFWNALYAPDITASDEPLPVPAGFDGAEVEAAFDAFAAAAH